MTRSSTIQKVCVVWASSGITEDVAHQTTLMIRKYITLVCVSVNIFTSSGIMLYHIFSNKDSSFEYLVKPITFDLLQTLCC